MDDRDHMRDLIVAPPRGERGLKFSFGAALPPLALVAPPRGERGLKSFLQLFYPAPKIVAPPRGERGLKSLATAESMDIVESLPLVGSVD